MKKRLTLIGWYILFIILLVLCCMFASSCKTQYVPVETVRTEYINRTDTVHKTDTVTNERETVIREVNKGDSALLAKYGIQIKNNERMLLFLQRELDKERSKEREVQHDTVVVNDTIRVPYPVEREASLSERLGEKVFYLLILAVLLYFIFRRQK